MLWFIAALALASIMFFFTPEKAVQSTDYSSSFFKKLSQHSLLALPIIILTWLVVAIVRAPMTPFAGTAVGFVLTSCTVAVPQLHRYLALIASLTFAALLLELTLYL